MNTASQKRHLPLGILLAWFVAGATGARALGFDIPGQDPKDVVAEAIWSAAFYMANFAVIALLMAIALSLRHMVWTGYTLLVMLGLVYIGLFEQNLTGVVWAGYDVSPQTLLVCGFAMLSVNFLVAAAAIQPQHAWARLKTPFRLAAPGIWLPWYLGTLVSLEVGYALFSIAGCLVAVAHFFPVSTFARLRGGYDQLIRNSIWVLLLLILVAASVIITDVFGFRSLTVTINRLLIMTITLGFAFLFIRNIFVLKSDHELAVQESLDQALEQIRIGQRLREAQEQHSAALEVTRLQNMRLATASHDIRQPISSLRATVAVLVRDQPEEIRRHLRISLDYLDELAASYLEEAKDGPPRAAEAGPAEARDTHAGGIETVSTDLIGETLSRMFAADATARGLRLDVAVTPATLVTQPLALMRILSNIVTNAITHGDDGTVRLVGEVSGSTYDFHVTNGGRADLAFDAWAKSDGSPGSGLGLAIVRQQAERAGMTVTLGGEDAHETRLTISVPIGKAVAP